MFCIPSFALRNPSDLRRPLSVSCCITSSECKGPEVSAVLYFVLLWALQGVLLPWIHPPLQCHLLNEVKSHIILWTIFYSSLRCSWLSGEKSIISAYIVIQNYHVQLPPEIFWIKRDGTKPQKPSIFPEFSTTTSSTFPSSSFNICY